MGEAKQRAKVANDSKVIEASERERIAVCLFFGNAVQPENRVDQRRYSRLFDDLDLDGADAARVARIKSAEDPAEGVPLSSFSDEAEEFNTTMDVVEYFLKATDTKIPGTLSRAILPLVERMLSLKEGTYKAPSVRAAEAAPQPDQGPGI